MKSLKSGIPARSTGRRVSRQKTNLQSAEKYQEEVVQWSETPNCRNKILESWTVD